MYSRTYYSPDMKLGFVSNFLEVIFRVTILADLDTLP